MIGKMCAYDCALDDVSWLEACVRADAMTGKWSQSIRCPETVVVFEWWLRAT